MLAGALVDQLARAPAFDASYQYRLFLKTCTTGGGVGGVAHFSVCAFVRLHAYTLVSECLCFWHLMRPSRGEALAEPGRDMVFHM